MMVLVAWKSLMVVRISQLLLHADDVLNIIDEDRRGLKVNDDGHHDATKVVTDDLKINVEGHCGPKIADEDHRLHYC